MRRGVAVPWMYAVALAGLLGCGSETTASEVIEGGGDASVPPPSCAVLESCCPTLPSDVVSSCERLGLQAGATECSAELTALGSAGRCIGVADGGVTEDAGVGADASAKVDGGGRADAAASDGGSSIACILLDACCTSPSLAANETATCTSIEGEGSEGLCESELATLVASDECSGESFGTGGACPELQQCCESAAFPSTFAGNCASILMQGDNSTCASTLSGFMAAGLCGGSVPFADGGHAPDPDCTMLSMCCNEITFPASTLSTCQQIASANEGGTCLSAYESYAALAYCE